MSFAPEGLLVVAAGYLLPLVVVPVLAYLVIRFAVRDGLRGHQRWLERRGAAPDPRSSPD